MEKKKAIILLIIVSLFVGGFTLIRFLPDTISSNNTNSVINGEFSTGFKITPSMVSVACGDVFDLEVFLYNNDIIDTAAIDNLTFTSGLLEIRHIGLGNLFRGTTMWMTGKTIDNEHGYVMGILWTDQETTSESGLFCTITFEAMNVGTAFVDITSFGIACAGKKISCSVLSNAIVEIN